MAETVDTAYVDIFPRFPDFGGRVRAQMAQVNRSISTGLSGGLSRAQGSTRELNRHFDGLNSRVSFLSRIGPRAFSIFATGAAAAGIGGLALGVKGFISEAREAQKVSASTTQGIKTIGAGSWTSTKAIEALSQATSAKIGVDDELIQQSANLLLTFKLIKNAAGENNNIFDRAVIASQDLAAKGFGSSESAAKMLGKALNDPLKGITALSRAGVTFSQKQKDQIKSLVESGDMLTAQKLILKEVEAQVGGTAEATATGGEKMRVVWDNFREFMGTKILPVLDGVASLIVDRIMPVVGRFGDLLGTGFSALAAAFKEGDVTSDGFVGTMERVGVALRGVTDWVQDKLVPALSDLAENVGPVLLIIFEDIGWVLQNVLVPALAIVGGIIVNYVIPAISTLAKWIKDNQEIIPALGIAIGLYLVPAFIAWAAGAAVAAAATIAAAAPVIAIVAVIAAAAFLIIKYWDNITGAFKNAFNWVKDNWPLLLAIVTGPIGIATKLIIDNWQTVKETFVTVFSAIGVGLAELAKAFIRFGKFAFDAIWNFVLTPLRTMLDVMSKLPLGMGTPFKKARDALNGFKDSADDAFNGAIGKVNDWEDTLKKAPKIVRLQADIKDLDTKLASARKQLKDPNLTKERRAKLNADIDALLRQKKRAQDSINSLKGKTVPVQLKMDNRLVIMARERGVSLTITGKPIAFARGGGVKGPGGVDQVPAMLTAGEYVIKADSARRLGPRLLDLLNDATSIGGDPGALVLRFATGGSVPTTQSYIRAQQGEQYLLGGAGPNTWDCSGITGAAYAILRGLGFGHGQRYMTTQSNFAGLGFKRGLGAYTIGVSPAAGHMVGNIGGMPFEAARPGVGLRVGNAATSVKSMAQQWFLASLGGVFGGTGGVSFTMKQILRSIIPDYVDHIPRYAAGTPWVPQTGLYELHRGERVVPSWANNGAGEGLTVNAAPINIYAAPGMDEEALAQLVDQRQRESMKDLLRELRTGVRR